MLQDIKFSYEETLLKLDKLKFDRSTIEIEIDNTYKKLKFLSKKIDELYDKLGKFKKRDEQIYIEKTIYGWSNDKISFHHNAITRQHISRIVDKIERKFNDEVTQNGSK